MCMLDQILHLEVESIVTLRVFITLTMMECKFALKNEKNISSNYWNQRNEMFVS